VRQSEGTPFGPVQPPADAIIYVVTRPRHVAVNEMLIRPTEQER
jgi:NADP-dependent 3-hydroxy acid dehydrogenase YdfG